MSVLLWHLGVSGLCLDESHSLFVCIMWAHTHTNTSTVCVCVSASLLPEVECTYLVPLSAFLPLTS